MIHDIYHVSRMMKISRLGMYTKYICATINHKQ